MTHRTWDGVTMRDLVGPDEARTYADWVCVDCGEWMGKHVDKDHPYRMPGTEAAA